MKCQKYWKCKVLLSIMKTTITQLNSLFCCNIDPLSVDVWWVYWWNEPNSSITIKSLPRHINIMTNKVFNLLNEYAAKRVHLFPQEEKYTSSSWGDSKMYTSVSISKSQRILIELNESGAIAKIRIWVSKWYCQTL